MSKKIAGAQEKFVYTDNEGNETEYLLQHPGVRKGMEIKTDFFDEVDNKIDMSKKNEALMKHVIVKPRVNWEYLEEVGMDHADALLKAASKFLG